MMKLLIMLVAVTMAMCLDKAVAATPASSSVFTLVSAKSGCVANDRGTVAVLHRRERPGIILMVW